MTIDELRGRLDLICQHSKSLGELPERNYQNKKQRATALKLQELRHHHILKIIEVFDAMRGDANDQE